MQSNQHGRFQIVILQSTPAVPEFHTLLPSALVFGTVVASVATFFGETSYLGVGAMSAAMICVGCTRSMGDEFLSGVCGVIALCFVSSAKDPKSVVTNFAVCTLVSVAFKISVRIFRWHTYNGTRKKVDK